VIRNLDLTALPTAQNIVFTPCYGPNISATVAFTLAGNDQADIRAWANALHADVEEHAPHQITAGVWMGTASTEAEIDGLRVEVYQSWPLPEYDQVILHGGAGLWLVPNETGAVR
jgi:hypothetical protein